MQLTPDELSLTLEALNDREGVLSADWEAASRANSIAKMTTLCDQLRAVRTLADKIARHQITTRRLAA